MPLIKSAIKKMHQDRARTKVNEARKAALKKAIKAANAATNQETLANAYSVLDRLAKKGLIHKNKAARGKAALAKLAAKNPSDSTPKTPKKVVKTTKAKSKAK